MRTVVLLLALSGCSFAVLRAPRNVGGKVDCDDSETLPVVDVLVGLSAAIATGLIVEKQLCGDNPVNCPLGIPVSAGALALGPWVGSAAYGMHRVKQCRAAKAGYDPEQPARDDAARVQLLTLMQSAQAAARAGDCATVKAIDADVRARDHLDAASFRDTVFLADPAIAACIAPPPPPPARSDPQAEEAAGDAAVAIGDHAAAARHYIDSFEANHDPQLLYKIGGAYVLAGRCADALPYLERYLDEAKPAPDRTAATRGQIAACRAAPSP